jgi:hypothetical protein
VRWRVRTRCAETDELLEDIVKPFASRQDAEEFRQFTQRFVQNVAAMGGAMLEYRPYRDGVAMRINGGRWAAIVIEQEDDDGITG